MLRTKTISINLLSHIILFVVMINAIEMVYAFLE